MGSTDIGHPVPHRLVYRVFERLLTGGDGPHFSAHQSHPKHIQRLPLHIDGSHIHDAFEAKLRAHGRSRHPVLTGTGFRNDPLFPHAQREHGLTQGVVDLVRTRVQQILALEINLGAPAVRRESLSEIKLRRPPCEFLQVLL